MRCSRRRSLPRPRGRGGALVAADAFAAARAAREHRAALQARTLDRFLPRGADAPLKRVGRLLGSKEGHSHANRQALAGRDDLLDRTGRAAAGAHRPGSRALLVGWLSAMPPPPSLKLYATAPYCACAATGASKTPSAQTTATTSA